MALVFDAGALVAMIKGEPGAALVEQKLLDNPGECYAHAVNICEVFYPILRADGMDEAQRVLGDLEAIGLESREDMDAALWQSAAGYKAAYSMSLADAFCVALASRMDAELITSDRHELEPLLADGVAKITFIR
jgi:PIN domain nuclease of toxin-antitoxin system